MLRKNLVLIHRSFLFGQRLLLHALIDAIAVRFKLRRSGGRAERRASRREGRNTTLYVFLIAFVS